MKKNTLSLYAACLLLAVTACTKPHESRDELGAAISTAQLKFTVTQNPQYDNAITMTSTTPGVIPYWDYVFGTSNEAVKTDTIPFAGEFWIKYTAYAHGGPASDSVKIKVTQNDPNYFKDSTWNLLTNGTAGKTWVWATGNPSGAVYGNGPGDASSPQWWQVPAATLSSSLGKPAYIINDEMTFNLDGGYNYQYTSNGATTNAKYSLDIANKKLTIIGSDISSGGGIPYTIVTLNANELTLAQQGDGWRNIWMFKRKGYSY